MMRILLISLLLLEVFALESWEETSSSDPGEMPPVETSYENFRMQHINTHMTARDCDSVIKQRKIYNNGGCKKTNSFILADANKVKSICKGEGNYDRTSTLTSSKARFHIVVCKLKNGGRKPNCHYRGWLLTHRVVVVKCVGNLPVHYDHDFYNF
uniref:Ribonuclease A-domain domain-containing protein n=1 Tax=Iconisemion striatum TaxID=60296 RepID=A0A1A7X9A3_9TELE